MDVPILPLVQRVALALVLLVSVTLVCYVYSRSGTAASACSNQIYHQDFVFPPLGFGHGFEEEVRKKLRCPGEKLPHEGGVQWMDEEDYSLLPGRVNHFGIRAHPDLQHYIQDELENQTADVKLMYYVSILDGLQSASSAKTTGIVRQIDPEKDPYFFHGTFVCSHPPFCEVTVYALDLPGIIQVRVGRRRFRVLPKKAPSLQASEAYHQRRLCGSQDLVYPLGTWRSEQSAGLNTPLRRAGQAQMFSGWTYDMPSCRIPRFDLANSNVWIVILGTSTDRGTFLSLVDMLLPGERKLHFKDTEIQKCWGYMDFSAGGVRLTYQDLRFIYPFNYFKGDKEASSSFVCHNDRVAGNGKQLALNATRFVQEVLFNEKAERWPDVIMSHQMKLWLFPPADHVNGTLSHNIASKLVDLAKEFPKEWKGRWIISFYEGPLMRRPHFDQGEQYMRAVFDLFSSLSSRVDRRHEIKDALVLAQQELEKNIDNRIQLTTIWPVYYAKFDEVDGRQNNTFHSLHHHALFPDVPPFPYFKEYRVVSDVTQWLAFMLIHAASNQSRARIVPAAITDVAESTAGPRVGTGWKNLPTTSHEIKICTDCPKSLEPFHIKVPPTPHCVTVHSLPLVTNVTHPVWSNNAMSCPEWCLRTVQPKLIPTTKIPVEERICKRSEQT